MDNKWLMLGLKAFNANEYQQFEIIARDSEYYPWEIVGIKTNLDSIKVGLGIFKTSCEARKSLRDCLSINDLTK